MLILGVEPRIPAYKTSVITVSLYERFVGENWELNPGPSAPKADIIPLDYFPPTYYYHKASLSYFLHINYRTTYGLKP